MKPWGYNLPFSCRPPFFTPQNNAERRGQEGESVFGSEDAIPSYGFNARTVGVYNEAGHPARIVADNRPGSIFELAKARFRGTLSGTESACAARAKGPGGRGPVAGRDVRGRSRISTWERGSRW